MSGDSMKIDEEHFAVACIILWLRTTVFFNIFQSIGVLWTNLTNVSESFYSIIIMYKAMVLCT